jgi:outer membrane protein OmpA-like peptidoglycan-associated protein
MSPRNRRFVIIAALAALAFVVASVVLLTTGSDDDPDTETATAAGDQADDAPDGGGDGSGASGDDAEGSGAAGGDADAAEGDTDAAAGGGDAGLDLPEADLEAPPQEPVGVYRQGKIILGGSVPSEQVAAGYLRRTAAVLGDDNIVMQMAVDPRVWGGQLTIDVDERFQFPSGSAAFDPRFGALLDLGAAALQLWPEATLVVTGHSDDVGDEAANLALSQARAQVVVDWMVENGLNPERVVARGAGELDPVATNETPEGRQANRRIEASMEGITPE